MAHSNRRRASGKVGRDFPLRIHKGTGYWCKKVRGRVYYFGKVAEDPDGKAALEEWNRVKDDLLAGREPRAHKADALTVADLANEYLAHHEARRDRGEISPRTFQGMYATCATLVKVFGKTRAVADLRPDDFGRLRAKLAENRHAVALRNEMQRCRSVFRFGFINRLIDAPAEYGSKFGKPELKQVRRERRENRDAHGKRMFTAPEIRAILAEAKQPLRAMVLLAINCGYGQTDLARLPVGYVDLDKGIIDYPRPKTEADRLCPLWRETVEAIREWLPMRPKPKDPANADLMFLTARGTSWVKVGIGGRPKLKTDGKPMLDASGQPVVSNPGMPADAIGQEFAKLLVKLGLKRAGLNFYGLRHSHRTVTDEVRDPVAAALIMGHVPPPNDMSVHYREDVSLDRLRAVVEHVRAWLWPQPAEQPTAEKPKRERKPRAVKAKTETAPEAEPKLRLFAG